MKIIIFLAAIAATATSAFAADVGVSVSIGQPGFYGQIDIGDYPQPRVLYREPKLIKRGPHNRPPIYMRVPPGHAKQWDKHCREYNACDQRVYFVQDKWYNQEYVPRYQERHRVRHADERGHGNSRDNHRNDQGDLQNDRGNDGKGNRN